MTLAAIISGMGGAHLGIVFYEPIRYLHNLLKFYMCGKAVRNHGGAVGVLPLWIVIRKTEYSYLFA